MALRAPSMTLCSTALAALTGCAIVQALPSLPSFPVLVAMALLATGLLAVRRWPALRLPAVAMLFAAWACMDATHRLRARLTPALEGRDIVITGRIADLPRRVGADVGFLFEPIPREGEPTIDGVARVTWYRAPQLPGACETWRLAVRLRRPRGLVNPGGNDAERGALLRNVAAVGYVRTSTVNARLGSGPCVDGWRDAIGRGMDGMLGAGPSRLLKALAVGDTRGLDAADWDVARSTGVSHLIAISGFHVGVAAGGGVLAGRGLYFLLPWLATWLPQRMAQAALGLGVAFAYGLLAGMGLPTVRTLLMVAVLVVAALRRKRAGGIPLLAVALLAVLVVDPLAVLSAGFWLSFGGVAFLMTCVAPGRPGWRGALLALLRTQLVMSVALLPLSLWLFGSASLSSLPANLVAAPLVSFAIIPLTLLGSLLLAWPAMSTPLLSVAAALMDLLWQGLVPLSSLPDARWSVPEGGPLPVLLATIAAAWLFAPRGVPLRGFALLCFLPIALPARDSPEHGGFQAWVLDVGQGLSVVLRTRTHTLVYDAGPDYAHGGDAGAGVVLPAISALGIGPVDRLVVSHGDADHAGGAASVLRRYPDAAALSGEPERLRFPAAACMATQAWQWDGIRFRFIEVPLPAGGKVKANDRSCVLAVEGASGRLLLTGDIGSTLDQRIDPAQLESGLPTVTTVAHHGSRHASSTPWLRRVRPTIAVVSAGWRNRFGHPHPDVVDRHAAIGAAVYATPRSGALRIDFPADDIPRVTREWRRPRTRYWRE
ncbi:DNA internalization-related competence protein ComEC/Rec2 [Bacillus sp. NP157]|nr:DNA internalization-related competence protein ComEC/Rec2 [Bacillus sp. NP157]